MNRILKTSSMVFLTIFILTLTINKTQLINIEEFYSDFYIIWYALLSKIVILLNISTLILISLIVWTIISYVEGESVNLIN